MARNTYLRLVFNAVFLIGISSYASLVHSQSYEDYLNNPDAFEIQKISLNKGSNLADDFLITAKFCGSGGCLFNIIETSRDGTKKSLFEGLALKVEALNSFNNGYREFSIKYFSDYDGYKSTPKTKKFSFDGLKYAQVEQVKEVDEFTQLIISYQNALNKLGYNAGVADGDIGRNTERAIQRFQRKNRLPVTGFLTEEQGYYLIDLAKRNTQTSNVINRRAKQNTRSANAKKITTRREWIQIQSRLKSLGYSSGKIDGKPGLNTVKAIAAFQAANNLEADGKIGPATREVLFSNNASRYNKKVKVVDASENQIIKPIKSKKQKSLHQLDEEITIVPLGLKLRKTFGSELISRTKFTKILKEHYTKRYFEVTAVREGGAAFNAGLQPGDFIKSILFGSHEQNIGRYHGITTRNYKISRLAEMSNDFRKYRKGTIRVGFPAKRKSFEFMSTNYMKFVWNDNFDGNWISKGGSKGLRFLDSEAIVIPREPLPNQPQTQLNYISPESEEGKKRKRERIAQNLAEEEARLKNIRIKPKGPPLPLFKCLHAGARYDSRCDEVTKKTVGGINDFISGKTIPKPGETGFAENELKWSLFWSMLKGGGSPQKQFSGLIDSTNQFNNRRHDRYLKYASEGKVCFTPKTAELCVSYNKFLGTYLLGHGIRQTQSVRVNSCSGKCSGAVGWCDQTTGVVYESIVAFEEASCRAASSEEINAIKARKY